jgi:outer membrane protein TolC
VQRALQRNFDQVRVGLLAVQSESDRATALATILPRVDLSASATENVVRGGNVQFSYFDPVNGQRINSIVPNQTYRVYQFGVQLKQLVFDGGKWWNNLAAASAQLGGLRANVEEQRLTTVYGTEQRFFELVRQQRQLQVLTEAAARSRDQAGFTQRLFEGGRATQADVYQARANRDTDEINRLAQEARVELARQDLAMIIGADPTEPLTVAEPPGLQETPAPPGKPAELVQKALAARPSLQAFQLFVEAQRRSLSAAKGDYYPAVSLVGQYQRNTRDFGDLSAGPDKVGALSAGVNLSWNLFAGQATNAAVLRQEQQVLLAENDLMNGRRGVASDVERAVAQLAAARQEALVAAQAVATSQEGLRLARARQQVGVATQLEVRDAELKLTQSELARVNALIDGRESESALKRAAGG